MVEGDGVVVVVGDGVVFGAGDGVGVGGGSAGAVAVGAGDGFGFGVGEGVGDGVVGMMAKGGGGDAWWGLIGRLRSCLRWRIDSFKLETATRNGVAGSGLRRMLRRLVRTIVSFSVLDDFGMVQLWGKNSTVLEVHLRFVIGL